MCSNFAAIKIRGKLKILSRNQLLFVQFHGGLGLGGVNLNNIHRIVFHGHFQHFAFQPIDDQSSYHIEPVN